MSGVSDAGRTATRGRLSSREHSAARVLPGRASGTRALVSCREERDSPRRLKLNEAVLGTLNLGLVVGRGELERVNGDEEGSGGGGEVLHG